MKYIQKVILTNFQSHKHTEIEFNNGLNIVVGPSDSGKTAILRGIKWVLFNEPSGDYFIREGEDECSVEILFNEGTRIKRYRSKSKNIYYLYDNSNNEFKFEGFGVYVPEEIIMATGIKKVLLDSDTSKSINLSEQLEGAFLLSERTSTRANSIGRLVGVNIIDDALRDSLRDSRNLAIQKRDVDEKITDLKRDLKDYEYLDELRENVDKLDQLRGIIYKKSQLISDYKRLHSEYKTITEEIKLLNIRLEKLKNVDKLIYLQTIISEKMKLHYHLTKQSNILGNISTNKLKNKRVIDSLKYINLIDLNYHKIESLNTKVKTLVNRQIQYKNVKTEIKQIQVISNKLKSLNCVYNASNEIANNLQIFNKLISIKERKLLIGSRLEIGINYVEKLKTIDSIPVIYKELEDKYNRLNILNNYWKNYNLKKKEISKETIKSNQLKEIMEDYIDKYKKLLLQLEVCPLCFSDIDNEKIIHIISHYD